MKFKTILVLSLIATLSLDAQALSTKKPIASPTPTASPVATATPSANLPNITFKCVVCTDAERKTIQYVQDTIPKVVKSQCFADHFISEKYRSQLTQTNGLTRDEVVQKIRTSIVRDIPIEFYWPKWNQSKSVIGYTTPSTATIYLNRTPRSYSSWSMDSEVSNLLHESTHKAPMSFDHDYSATARRPFSVPYTANYAVSECLKGGVIQ